MTRLGFLLDSSACIGCHACTVACKSEHDVPLGVNRTWVKYIETGEFPDTSRHFSVMRCNHCDDAPCMSICPTGALFRADNGVVDFDDSLCIGCKGCMNACPYDAIYINPETNTAHKCNFCNHRIEVGLEPSCVIVCPTQAITVGDLDDPTSTLSRAVATEGLPVRAPEQGTKPKVYYRGADEASLDPLRTRIPDDGMIWAESTADHPTIASHDSGVVARTTYTTAHPVAWREKVSAYLVTKAIAAGVMFMAVLLVLLGNSDAQAAVGVVPPIVAGAFTALTGVLLVADLKQPKRFYFLLTKPNTGSWIVRGAWVLGAFAIATAIWFIGGVIEAAGLIEAMALPVALLAVAAAGYTALLFAQCEGRDLWQSRLVLPQLLAQALIAGASTFALLDLFIDVPEPDAVRWALLTGAVASLIVTALEVVVHDSRHVELATRALTADPRFWFGVVVGLVVPALLVLIALVADTGAGLPAVAGAAAIVGLFSAEDAFVRAGQAVPLS